MATLAELQAQRDQLQKARASSALSIQHGDKRITFKSAEELDRALTSIDREIEKLSGKRRTRQVRIYTDRGL